MNKIWIGLLVILLSVLAVFFLFGRENKLITPNTSQNQSQSQATVPTNGELGMTLDMPLEAAEGFNIGIFAKAVGNARDLQFSPGGTLLVSSPGNSQVVALPDRNNDGIADEQKVVVSSGVKPHGLAFYNGKLYVAEVNRVARYIWKEESLVASFEKEILMIPGGGNHSSRTIIFDNNGRMFVSIGSTCNVCKESHAWIATVIASDNEGRNPRLFASGLRNAPFMTFRPNTNDIWVTEMGRDLLGDNLPPDEINILKDGKNFGWPYCYGNKVQDKDFDSSVDSIRRCEISEPPVYQIAAHSAPLGIAFVTSKLFPSDWQGDLLVAYHGSWNRSTKIGYKVVRLDVDGNTIRGEEDFLFGFLQNGTVIGRPVDMTFDTSGNLYVSDDNTGNIYILSKKQD